MQTELPGVGRRALATIIDQIPLIGIALLLFQAHGTMTTTTARRGSSTFVGASAELGATGTLLLLLCVAFYYIGMEYTFGGTFGKLLIGIRVRRANGDPVTLWGAVARFLLRPIDGMFGYLVGALFIWATSGNQRLGDLLGGARVVYRDWEAARPPADLPLGSPW